MKKIFTLVLAALLAISLAAGLAWAEPGKGGGPKKNTKVEKQVGNEKQRGHSKAVAEDEVFQPFNSKKTKKARIKTYEVDNVNAVADEVYQPDKSKKTKKVKNKTYKKIDKTMMGNGFAMKGKKFKDTEKHWASNSIERMSALGLFSGYADGTFKPDTNISQVEMIVLLIRLVEEQNSVADSVYDEDDSVADSVYDEDDSVADSVYLNTVPGWARHQVKLAADLRIVNMSRFHSAQQASRVQTCVAFAKALGLEPAEIQGQIPFKDGILVTQEDLGYILAMYNEGFITGMPGGKFNPNHAITRAEMTVIVERILDLDDSEDDDDDDDDE